MSNYLLDNDLINYVNDFTRICTSYYTKKKESTTSKTLIDVVIHNQNKITRTKVFGCPFSDHNFVLSSLAFESGKNLPPENTPGRCLSDENLIKINQKIELADLAFLDKENDINENWLKFKETLLGIIDDVAPIKKIKMKAKEQFPWMDKQLNEKKKLRDFFFFESKESTNA